MADLVIVPFVPRSAVVPWLGAGTTLGLTGSGVALLFLVRRFRGRDALPAARAPPWPAWPARWPEPRPASAWRPGCG